MITLLKVLLTIILIPLKIVFFIFAYLFALIIVIVISPLQFITDSLGIINKLFTPLLIVSAIGVDIFIINQIKSGVTPLVEGIFLMVGITLSSTLLLVIFNLFDRISEAILSFATTLTDWAKANWFAFW